MPYKANADRRHKIPKMRYRVTNWPDYDAALVRRGSLTLWLTEEALAAWHAPATGKRGGQPIYSEVAIETGPAASIRPRAAISRTSPEVSTLLPWSASSSSGSDASRATLMRCSGVSVRG